MLQGTRLGTPWGLWLSGSPGSGSNRGKEKNGGCFSIPWTAPAACLPLRKLHQQLANFPPLCLNSILPSGKRLCVPFISRSSPVDPWIWLMGSCFWPHWAVTDPQTEWHKLLIVSACNSWNGVNDSKGRKTAIISLSWKKKTPLALQKAY